MKAKHKKLLHFLSQKLPVSYELRNHTEAKFGYDVSVEARKDEVLDPKAVYKLTGPKYIPIVHYNRLKKAFRKKGGRGGTQGVIDYVNWVEMNNRNLAKIMDDIQQVDEGILKVLKSGVSGFWKSLLIFFYSFMTVFSKENVK